LKAERHIISKKCMLQYIPVDIFRASIKFFMGDKLREKMEGVPTMSLLKYKKFCTLDLNLWPPALELRTLPLDHQS
jgi:hypothetical protein